MASLFDNTNENSRASVQITVKLIVISSLLYLQHTVVSTIWSEGCLNTLWVHVEGSQLNLSLLNYWSRESKQRSEARFVLLNTQNIRLDLSKAMNIILRMNYLNSGGHAALSVLNRWLSPWQLKQFRVCVCVCEATGNQWRASTPELALCGPEEGCWCWFLPQLINRSVVWSVNCQDMSKEMSVSVSKKTSSKVLFCPQRKEKTESIHV